MEIDISKYPAYLKHDLEELINAEKKRVRRVITWIA